MNVNDKLVNSIMSECGLYGMPRPGRRKPNLIGVETPVDLVKRRFTAEIPNQLWCTDITEHPARDGKVYCCAILDCFSRMIVARTFLMSAATSLVNNAVIRDRVRNALDAHLLDPSTRMTADRNKGNRSTGPPNGSPSSRPHRCSLACRLRRPSRPVFA